MESSFLKSFNRRFQDGMLTDALFSTLGEARQQLRAWRADYNHHRPHAGVRTMTSAEFMVSKGRKLRAASLRNRPAGSPNGQRRAGFQVRMRLRRDCATIEIEHRVTTV